VFGVTESSPFDLNFRMLSAPVRITGWFWLISLMIGGQHDPLMAAIWVGSVLVSILVHEFGHGLMARRFGHNFQVTLHGMGGVCTYDSEHDTTGQRLAVLAAGPFAQLLFLVLICIVFGGWLGLTASSNLGFAQLLLGIDPDNSSAGNLMMAMRRHPTAFKVYESLFQINLLWPLLNLLPIWPLDGGQIACESLAHLNPRDGRRRGHILSLLTSGLFIIYILFQSQGQPTNDTFFRILWFGFFGYLNYQVLHAYQSRYTAYGPDNDGDWR